MKGKLHPVVLCGGSGSRLWPMSRRLLPKQFLPLVSERSMLQVVVSGTARVTRGDEVMTISENESTYIPLGVKHRLENPGKLPLYLIEAQSGSYLGEDDIVRFDDRYKRD